VCGVHPAAPQLVAQAFAFGAQRVDLVPEIYLGVYIEYLMILFATLHSALSAARTVRGRFIDLTRNAVLKFF
jgi:hypothetical protein